MRRSCCPGQGGHDRDGSLLIAQRNKALAPCIFVAYTCGASSRRWCTAGVVSGLMALCEPSEARLNAARRSIGAIAPLRCRSYKQTVAAASVLNFSVTQTATRPVIPSRRPCLAGFVWSLERRAGFLVKAARPARAPITRTSYGHPTPCSAASLPFPSFRGEGCWLTYCEPGRVTKGLGSS